MQEVHKEPGGRCAARKRASHERPWRAQIAAQVAQLQPLRGKKSEQTDSCSYSTVKNGAQELNCK
eukprot:6183088-Pleurochrysis_carterae.AAC.1